MRIAVLLTIAMLSLAAGSLSAGSVVTQEVVNVRGYVKGSTTLKLSGTLSETAMEALSKGASVSIRNNLANYLCAPTQLDKNDKGFAKKAGTQKISAKLKNGKFSWTEKDVTKNFAFAVGDEIIKLTKANLKSSGSLKTEDVAEFETKKATLFDLLCDNEIGGSVGAYVFTPEKKGENFKYSAKEQNVQVKFSANSKGKSYLSYKFSPDAVSPAVIGENYYEDPFSVTNKSYVVIDLSGGPNVEAYPMSYLESEPEGGWTEEYKTTKLVLRKIEPGTFTMGSPEDELGRENSETQHEVTLTKAYYISVFEVTQRQCENIMGENPSSYKGDMRPMEHVSYDMLRGANKGSAWPENNAVDEWSFMGQMRKKAGNIFDLPTEAQWEYACRAGTTAALNSGQDLSNRFECKEMSEVGRYECDHYDGKGGYPQHTTVGSYIPNAWGLYDMHGNVWEWCLDWFVQYTGDATDPKGGEEGEFRILRGGSFQDYAYCCRSAYRRDAQRSQGYHGFANFVYGLRVVLNP